jgi:NAD(P)-dependent dehydrogenase (short-subunit alcohol dehydrogenase family)
LNLAKHRISLHNIYSGDRQSRTIDLSEEYVMSDKFEGKIAVITGGSSGMGLATAKRFVQEGMNHVFITGRRKDALDAAVAEIGTNVTALQGDVANLSDIDRLYDAVKKHHRPIDIIFANAGLAKLAPFGTVDEEFFDLHFNANVKGLFFTVQKGLPVMRDGGSIILTGSIANIKGFPAISVYSATKAAVRSFARTWTSDLRDRRIRVNVLSPGHIDTPIFEGWQQGDAQNPFRSAGWEIRTRSRRPSPSWHLMRLAMSQARNCTWMAAWPKSKPYKLR